MRRSTAAVPATTRSLARRAAVCAALAAALVAIAGGSAVADHVPTSVSVPTGLPSGNAVLQLGDISWVSNAQAGHGVAGPLGEIGPFERDGNRYLIASDSVYGLTVLDITDAKEPQPISTYASTAGCPTGDAEFVASKIDDVAGEPGALFDVLVDAGLGAVGWENDLSVTPDGRFAVIGTDAPGRCHDPEYGGVEIVDLSDLSNPRTLHLVRNVGYSHSITIDPFHPWLAYVSTSDGDDFVDVIDFSSCDGGVADVEACEPAVARIPFTARQYPSLKDPADPDDEIVKQGCHDIRFTETRAYCAAIDTTMILDTSSILDAGGALTGTLLTEGEHACPRIEASRAPGVMVTDCSGWSETAWEDRNAEGADVGMLAVITHDDSKPPEQDIEISHQAEPIEDGKILAITDERGGGLNPGAPACPGGGIWFYDIRDEKNPVLMETNEGKPAVFISERTRPSPFSCTVHYGEQFGDERVLTFAWYTGGTHVIEFEPDFSKTPATIFLNEIATYIPAGSWAIQSKPIMRDPDDPDQLIVYTADAARGLDVFSVTVPRAATSGTTTSDEDDESEDDDGTRVLGTRETLPATGIADPLTALGLLGSAAALATWTRRRL